MFCVGAIMGDCIGDGSMTGGRASLLRVSEQRVKVAVGRHGDNYWGSSTRRGEIAVNVMTGFRNSDMGMSLRPTEERIVCALRESVGDYLNPSNGGDAAKLLPLSLTRPTVSKGASSTS
jgi:hypothetical protein